MADASSPDPGFVPMSSEQLTKLRDDIANLLEALDSEREKSARWREQTAIARDKAIYLREAIARHRRNTSHTEPADLELWKALGEERM